MKINRLNYEVFFLDHMEGRLSRAQEKELQEFLATHPDLAAELADFEPVHLDDKEEIIFGGKSRIKKNESELTPVTQLIALMEGDLSSQEASELRKKIESDDYLKVQSELLQKTRLLPDFSIRFADKNKLKHKGRVVYMWRYAAVAACLITGLTIVFRNIPDKKEDKNVAQKSVPALPVTVTDRDNVNKENEVLTDKKKPVLQSLPKKLKQEEKASEQITFVSPLATNETGLPVKEAPLQIKPSASTETAQQELAPENTFSLKDVFSDDELNELKNMSETEESSWMQQLAKTSVNRLGELTGVQVQLPSREKQQDAFVFSAGNFEVRHVSVK